MKKNYVSPVTEQVEIKLEKHLLDLSFDDTPADPGDALGKKHVFDDMDDDYSDRVNVTSGGDVYVGNRRSLWDD